MADLLQSIRAILRESFLSIISVSPLIYNNKKINNNIHNQVFKTDTNRGRYYLYEFFNVMIRNSGWTKYNIVINTVLSSF